MSNLHKVFTNTKTNQQIIQAKAIDSEILYDGNIMISETDLNGTITYVNRKFLEMTGFNKKEIIGLPHSIIRHPDMPKGLYKAMWKIIPTKKVWRSYVKNLRKDGSYYWVLLYVQAKVDSKGVITGYIASRKPVYNDAKNEVEKQYTLRNLPKHIDDPYFMSFELYHGRTLAVRK